MTRLMMILEATLGGIRRHVVDLLEGLDRDRYEITFVYSSGRADAVFLTDLPRLAERGIRLVEIPMQREVGAASEVRALVRLRREMARVRPELVHGHGAKAGALGRLAAASCGIRRFVYTPHGGVFHKTVGLRGSAYLSIEKFLGRLCPTDYVGVSKHSCAEIRRCLGAPVDRVHLVYNGIDAADVKRRVEDAPEIRSTLDARGDAFIVLYPAMFFEVKGHQEFVEAVAAGRNRLRPEIVIVLAGDGPMRDSVTRYVERHGLKHIVRFVGFTSDVWAYYKACDLVVLPSRAEAFGYAALEAMAANRPVLATAAGSLPEIVEDGVSGELIEPAHLESIVDRINAFAADRERGRAFVRNGAEAAANDFALSKMVAETDRLYREVLER